MTLTKYKQKRNLKKSGEPKSTTTPTTTRQNKKSIFVIHRHEASHLHWDLRLEINGVLKSWAVPKEPPTTKGVKRLAIAVEDHPLDYATFEGTIPEGNYGAGKVEIWDNGDFELIENTAPLGVPQKFELRGKIEFKLKGKKMKGTFVLIKLLNKSRTRPSKKPNETKYAKNSWLFFKV